MWNYWILALDIQKNGPRRPGAVIITSLVTVVPPCARPVTIITGGRSSSATAAIRRNAHAIRRCISYEFAEL